MIWVDAHLSPAIAKWLKTDFEIESKSVRSLGLREADDFTIFAQARAADVIVLTKDADFPKLASRHGPPPKIIWLRCGNTSSAKLRTLLQLKLPTALQLFEDGEFIVEIQ